MKEINGKNWFVENKSQEIRDWFAKEYDDQSIKNWHYPYIGWVGVSSHNGVLGGQLSSFEREDRSAVQISFEDFKRLILNKIEYEIF